MRTLCVEAVKTQRVWLGVYYSRTSSPRLIANIVPERMFPGPGWLNCFVGRPLAIYLC
jgi:hypothetical protein